MNNPSFRTIVQENRDETVPCEAIGKLCIGNEFCARRFRRNAEAFVRELSRHLKFHKRAANLLLRIFDSGFLGSEKG